MDDDGFETIYPEKDPTGKKLGEAGAKMDAGKEDLLTVMQAAAESLTC